MQRTTARPAITPVAGDALNPLQKIEIRMVKTYDLLIPRHDEGGQWSVSLAPKTEGETLVV